MNKKGSVLMGVLLIIGFSILVGAPILQAANVQHRAAINDQMDTQAFYLAEAGIQHAKQAALELLQMMVAEGWTPADGIPSPFITVSRENYGPGDYDAAAYLTENGDGNYGIRLESNGIVGGATGLAKGTQVTFPLVSDGEGGGSGPGGGPGSGGSGGIGPLDSALYVQNRLTMTNSARIIGGVKTNATGRSSISFSNSAQIQGDLYVGSDGNPDTVIDWLWNVPHRQVVTGDVLQMGAVMNFVPVLLPEFPNFTSWGNLNLWHNDLEIDQDSRYDYVSIGSESELTVSVPAGETRSVRMRGLGMSNGGKLTVVGGGELALFIEDSINISNDHTAVRGTGGSKLTVYYKGSSFNISNSAVFEGTLVAESATVNIPNNVDISGNIFTGGSWVNISNSGTAEISLLYAPNASVQLSNEARIVGAIVADTCSMSNSATIVYDDSVRGLLGGGGSGSIGFGDSIWSPTR